MLVLAKRELIMSLRKTKQQPFQFVGWDCASSAINPFLDITRSDSVIPAPKRRESYQFLLSGQSRLTSLNKAKG